LAELFNRGGAGLVQDTPEDCRYILELQQDEIVRMVARGRKTAADAARLFGVHPATISRLLTRARADVSFKHAKYRAKSYAGKWFRATFGDVDNGLVYCAHLYKEDPHCQP